MSNHPSPIIIPNFKEKQHKMNFKKLIEIQYDIPSLNYNGMMCGEIKNICDDFINMIEDQIISKHSDLQYYVQGEYGDYLPSPFSNSNTINFTIQNIFYNLVCYNKKKYIFKIRFYSNSSKFDFFDTQKFPTYSVEINLI